jgi:hypothetical protein
VPGDAAAADELITGLRAANARLRDLLAGRDARVAELEAETGALRVLVADLQAQVVVRVYAGCSCRLGRGFSAKSGLG